MRITAIAREDLSNICNGLIPNEIHLELKGMIVPDSYGEHIGQYDIENQDMNLTLRKIMKQEIQDVLMRIEVVAIASQKEDIQYIRTMELKM